MKRILVITVVVMLIIGGLFCLVCADRYRCAVYWVEDGVFSKATCYVDEFPFMLDLFDPGFVSYTYAGEAIEYGHYDEAIELLKPLADKNYRDSAQMLNYCVEQERLGE